ncbi:tRNA pseudouridine synthase B [Kluyvera intermedia]|nr:tRNA pseudouridine synthase B [Kluyvera intermedia]
MSRPRRRGRDIHGVLLLDKPLGASSNDVLQKVKRIFNANRAGHTGALDPLATGMLPICLGEATKFFPVPAGLRQTLSGGCALRAAYRYFGCRRADRGRASG